MDLNVALKRRLSVFFNFYPVGRLIIDGEYVKKKFILYWGRLKPLLS
jgi:hypothetical protein